MPFRSIAHSVLLALIAVSCAQNHTASLQDGIPFETKAGSVLLKYDGESTLTIIADDKTAVIPARTPSTIFLSSDNSKMALNFGNGSGQVFDLEVYDLDTLDQISSGHLKSEIFETAKLSGCDVNEDEISYVIKKWDNSEALRIRPENWSRRSECSEINRDFIWKFPLLP